MKSTPDLILFVTIKFYMKEFINKKRMKKFTFAAVTLLIFCAIFAGCTGVSDPDNKDSGDKTPDKTHGAELNSTESEKAVASANTNFAFSLYDAISKETEVDSNIFYSPYSISSAFALVYEGAKENTADEISSVFYFPKSIDILRQGFRDLNTAINEENSAYDLSVANALWAEKTYPFLDSYMKTAEEYYSAETKNLNFIEKPEDSRLEINKWTEVKTNEKIKDLIPQGMIDSMTRLVITNAVYFKGDWVKEFDKNKTSKADFTTPAGKVVAVDMMQRTDEDALFDYAETETVQALKMPYESSDSNGLSMIILLPKDNTLSKAEDYLTFDKYSALTDSMKEEEVMVYLPKFKLETKYSLSDTLKSMGMKDAFSASADFSGMDGTKSLSISDVVHKAYVDVDEEGTEAAAATAVVMQLTSVIEKDPAFVFMADHPFIFTIQDDKTGNILFVGRICNPES